MTANQIIGYLQAPEKLNRETLPVLKELTEKYPAFEAGWLLYLKNLKLLRDSSFDQELISAAIRIHDRRKLYLFLNEMPPKNQEVDATPANQEISETTEIAGLDFPVEYQLEDSEKEEEEPEISVEETAAKKYSLIENFLKAQPKMPQIKEQEYVSPMDGPSPIVPESDDFVTETLASIYAQQGYYKRALQIFEKLSLKYPEKSSYFAAQIEKINNLMNN